LRRRSMDRGLTAVEVIGLAIRSEEEAAKFYGHLSRRIKNDVVRQRYRHLAQEEMNHKEKLAALYRKMVGSDDIPPRVPGDPDTAEGGTGPEVGLESMEELLRIAVQREQEAQDFYREAASNAKDPSGERILLYLADVEHSHEMILKAELEAYLRDAQWYMGEEGQEMIHTGP
jgi:rubrerythrin